MDLTGKTFGKYTVIEYAGVTKGRATHWLCQCQCGKLINIPTSRIIHRPPMMCNQCRCYKHGMSFTKEHVCWQHMKGRCYRDTPDAQHYKEKGITVCERWLLSFENFLEDMGPAPSPQHSIDRINSNGNYEPRNCRWATIIEQANNMCTNLNVTYKDETTTLALWCKKLNLVYSRVFYRLKHGWPVEQAFETSKYQRIERAPA